MFPVSVEVFIFQGALIRIPLSLRVQVIDDGEAYAKIKIGDEWKEVMQYGRRERNLFLEECSEGSRENGLKDEEGSGARPWKRNGSCAEPRIIACSGLETKLREQ